MKRALAGMLILAMILGTTACSKEKLNDRTRNDTPEVHQSDSMEAIAKMFPSLEGAVETDWEQITLGSGDDRIPGSTDYKYQGYIVLSDDAAEIYASAYEWKEVDPEVTFESVEAREGTWKYSYDFCKDIIPGYYGGLVWIDGNTILFSITTM